MDTRMLTVHDVQDVVTISQTRVYKTHHVDVQTTVDQMVENSLLMLIPKLVRISGSPTDYFQRK